MNNPDHLFVGHAAVAVPMAWLAQVQFPPKKAVITSLQQAVSFLAGAEEPEAASVRLGLENIISGTDPRGGTFAKQTLSAVAKLHDLNARWAVQALDAANNSQH